MFNISRRSERTIQVPANLRHSLKLVFVCSISFCLSLSIQPCLVSTTYLSVCFLPHYLIISSPFSATVSCLSVRLHSHVSSLRNIISQLVPFLPSTLSYLGVAEASHEALSLKHLSRGHQSIQPAQSSSEVPTTLVPL